jgi:hypothetical protein
VAIEATSHNEAVQQFLASRVLSTRPSLSSVSVDVETVEERQVLDGISLGDEASSVFSQFLEMQDGQKSVALDPLSLAFGLQRDFILDQSRLKCLFCTRRAAKSYTGGIYLFKEALDHPGSNLLFIGLTRLSAKGIIWKDVFKDLDRRLGTDCRFNETELTVTFPNGSVIYVTGIDADEDEMMKLLGKKYRLVFLDEGSLYNVDLRTLVYGILKPAMADQLGTICMAGTSSNNTRGLFFDVTRGLEGGWSVHQWTAVENPHTVNNWLWEVAEIAHDRPGFMATALFRQWYLNEWVIDTAVLVYKYDHARNSLPAIPPALLVKQAGWQHVLGLDLGFSDECAFTVLAFHEEDPRLFLRYAYKESGMDFTATAALVKKLDEKYHFNFKVVDGANKQGVEEMNRRHGLSLVPAEKKDKVDFIRLMNDDMLQGVMVALPEAQPVVEEWGTLVWSTDLAGKIIEPRKENPNLPNHGTDATLYAWRKCYQYLSERPKPVAKPGTAAWAKAEEERMWEAELEGARAEAEGSWTGWGDGT